MRLGERGRSVLEASEAEVGENGRKKLRAINRKARRWLWRDLHRLAGRMFDVARGDQSRGAFVLRRSADVVQPVVQLRRGGEAGRQRKGDDQERGKNSPRSRH